MRYIGIIILLVLCLTLGPVEEPIEEDTGELGTVYPQQWATGDGTVDDPWANDCIQKAYDFVPIGGTIFLRAGYYQLNARLTISKKINIIGEGRNKTIIKTADADGFYVNADYVTIKNLTVDGAAQTGAAGATPMHIVNCDYVVLEEIEAKNADYCGFDIYQVSHSSFQNIYSHNNSRHGMHPGSVIARRNMYNTYRDIYCWDNGVNGFDEQNTIEEPHENTYDNLHCWNNGEFGIYISRQTNGSIINSHAYNNGLEGIYMYGCRDFTIANCSTYSNEASGILLTECDNINISNVISKNNGTLDIVTRCGIYITSSLSTTLSNCQFYDDRTPMIQPYGIGTMGSTKYVEIMNCKLTPNLYGDIKNWAGAVITITGAKLAKF